MKMEIILVSVIVLVIDVSTLSNDYIESQASLCSYISLCTRSNTTDYYGEQRYASEVPCCRECSCDLQCVANGDCCPDYFLHFNETAANCSLDPLQPRKGLANVTDSESGCVRTHYGLINNDEGFRMVDSCPQNFTENTIRMRCEKQFDYMTADIYDHIPISNTLSGKSFKNKFCKICTTSDDGPYDFWETWFVCESSPIFEYPEFTSALDLVKKNFQTRNKACSIVLKPSFIPTVWKQTATCMREEIIDTCADEYIHTDAQIACNKYTWPIMVQNTFKLETYKNYACMICNGLQFNRDSPICWSGNFADIRHFSATLNIKLPQIDTNKSRDQQRNENSTQFLIGTSISHVNTPCQVGFVYDERKNMCRQMLCPTLFFTKNGQCQPVFVVMENVIYDIVLEILLPFSTNNAPAHVVVTALFSSLDDTFKERLGKENYELSLWTNSISADRINKNVTYVALLRVSWHFADGNYYALLEFVHHLMHVERQFPIFIVMKKTKVKINVGLRLGSLVQIERAVSYQLKYFTRFDHLTVENLKIVKQASKRKFHSLSTITNLRISKVSLCHRVMLYAKEIRYSTPYGEFIEVVATKRVVYYDDFLRVTTGARPTLSYYVCINDALSNIGESSSYVMNATDSIDSLFEWRTKEEVNVRAVSGNGSHGVENEERKDTSDSKSFVALAASLGFMTLVVCITVGLKRLYGQSQTSDGTDDDTVGRHDNIEMTNIGTRTENL